MTTFAASTVPGFRAALLAALNARAALQSVSVCDGPAPPADETREELIELLDADGEQTVPTMSRPTQPRRARY